MAEPGERQLLGPDRAARLRPRLQHGRLDARLGKADRCGEPVGSGADDQRAGGHELTCGDLQRQLVQQALRDVVAQAPERMLGLAPGDSIGLVDVPRHRVPGAGGAHPGLAVVRIEHEAVVARTHEVAVMRCQVKADQRNRRVGQDRGLAVAVVAHALLELVDVGRQRPAWSSGVTNRVIVT